MDQNQPIDVSAMNPDNAVSALKTYASLPLLQKAAQNLGYSSELIGEYQDILLVKKTSTAKPIIFWRNRHPFNNSLTSLGEDKFLQYQVLEHLNCSDHFATPKTLFFSTLLSEPDITKSILNKFTFPFILKKNCSSFARDVHLISSSTDLSAVLKSYLDLPSSRVFLLVQEYIPGTEYRVITNRQKPVLAYSKKPVFRPKLKPSKPILLDPMVFEEAVKSLYQLTNINFSGCDFIVTSENKIYLIEQNQFPCCYSFLQNFPEDNFIQVYQELLQEYQD